jgi:hypothetical protein
VTFTRGPDVQATSVLIENLDHDGLGNATGLGLFSRIPDSG